MNAEVQQKVEQMERASRTIRRACEGMSKDAADRVEAALDELLELLIQEAYRSARMGQDAAAAWNSAKQAWAVVARLQRRARR